MTLSCAAGNVLTGTPGTAIGFNINYDRFRSERAGYYHSVYRWPQGLNETVDLNETTFEGRGYTFEAGMLHASGDTLWTRTYGGPLGDYGYSVQQTQGGGYIVAGYTYSFGNSSQVYLIKTNASGDTIWSRTYGGASYDEGWFVQQTQDGGYIVAGQTESFGNSVQVYLIKTDANGSSGVETAGVRSQRLEVRITPTPNPFTSFSTVPGHSSELFTLYDVSGRKVGVYKGDRIGEGLRAGVYFMRIENGSGKPVRVVKVR